MQQFIIATTSFCTLLIYLLENILEGSSGTPDPELNIQGQETLSYPQLSQ
jgi:hypothetical protein